MTTGTLKSQAGEPDPEDAQGVRACCRSAWEEKQWCRCVEKKFRGTKIPCRWWGTFCTEPFEMLSRETDCRCEGQRLMCIRGMAPCPGMGHLLPSGAGRGVQPYPQLAVPSRANTSHQPTAPQRNSLPCSNTSLGAVEGSPHGKHTPKRGCHPLL